MKVYGPYIRKDNRKHVIVIDGNSRRTISYPRYILEQHLGRVLSHDETVDHINGDFTDDRLENLQIMTLADNIRKTKMLSPHRFIQFVCPICGSTSSRSIHVLAHNRKQGKRGPFCSKKCGGIASHIDSHELRTKIYSSDWNYIDPSTNKRLKSY